MDVYVADLISEIANDADARRLLAEEMVSAA